MPKCYICGEKVDIKLNHVWYYRNSSVIDYYDDEGMPVYKPMKSKTYEHIACAKLLGDDNV